MQGGWKSAFVHCMHAGEESPHWEGTVGWLWRLRLGVCVHMCVCVCVQVGETPAANG